MRIDAGCSGMAKLDAGQIASQLCAQGYLVVDNVFGLAGAAAIRAGVKELERGDKMKLGRLQHGTELNSDAMVRTPRQHAFFMTCATYMPPTARSPNAQVRNDKIVFITPESTCADALTEYMAEASSTRFEYTRYRFDEIRHTFAFEFEFDAGLP